MRKKIITVIFAGMLAGMNLLPVWASEVTESTAAQAEASAAEQEASGEMAPEEEETEEETSDGAVINPDNYVDVNVIDLSLHAESSGEFSPVYKYENPFKGKDTSQGVILEFYAKPTWEVHELGAIFAINGSGEYDGKLYFSPGSYLGFNSSGFGGYFDANLFDYTLVNDYIKDGAKIRIELMADGFAVYADDELCYDQTILDNPQAGGGDFTSESDFSPVLDWLSGADTLYFGYGSWWNAVGTNEANIELSRLNFCLKDGTIVMNQLQADKVLIESLGGSVEASEEIGSSGETAELKQIDVEIFDLDSVEYEGISMLVPMGIVIAIVAVLAVLVVVLVTKKRVYDEI